MRTLYPELEPFDVGLLSVSSIHTIYYEQSGRPDGEPVLFIHGGPGSSTSATHRRFFDPSHYRIIMFDQRGCGRSIPSGCIEENTTSHLVNDIEKIRAHLTIDRWQLFGGSWGSALSLFYCQKYPKHVSSLILRGIFLVSQREISWFYQDGASRIFPEEFSEFSGFIPDLDRSDLVASYYKILTSSDDNLKKAAARAWCRWEAATSFLLPRIDHIKKFDNPTVSIPFATIECHYFINHGFFSKTNTLLDGVRLMQNIPGRIIQGRYDMVCPMEAAWQLHRAWPKADFRILSNSGHSALEAETLSELICATDDFRIMR